MQEKTEEVLNRENQFTFFFPPCTSMAHSGWQTENPRADAAFQNCEQAGLKASRNSNGLWMHKWPATKSRPCLLAAESVFAHPLNETVDVSSRRRLPSKNNTARRFRRLKFRVTFISICLASATSRFHSHAIDFFFFVFFFFFHHAATSETPKLKTSTRGSRCDAGDGQGNFEKFRTGRWRFTSFVSFSVKRLAKRKQRGEANCPSSTLNSFAHSL